MGTRSRRWAAAGPPTAGVDLVLVRDGETSVVQAKHWSRDRVGVQLVRELYNVQCAVDAHHAMFVA
jgi:hypothetical protein